MTTTGPAHGNHGERRRAVEALDLLAPLLDGLDTGLLVALPSGRIVAANQAMAVMVGLEPPALVAMETVQFMDRLSTLVDDSPPLLADRRLMPSDHRVVCEDLEIARPTRAVIRWVAQRIEVAGEVVHMVACTDITAEVDLAAVQERSALTDRLTALMNRRGLEAVLMREHARSRRHAEPLSVILIDVDRFKQVNDVYGHATGDEVLRQVAAACAQAIRKCDIVGRWGGEEFLAVLPGASIEGGRVCAERLRAAVEALQLPCGVVTISSGVAEIGVGEDIEAAIRVADERLYAAKTGGRNRVC